VKKIPGMVKSAGTAVYDSVLAGGRAVKEFFSSKPRPKPEEPRPKLEYQVNLDILHQQVNNVVEGALKPIKEKVKPGVGVTEKILNKALEKPYEYLLARFVPKDPVERRAQLNEMVTLKVKHLLVGMRSDGKEIDVLGTKITFTKTSIKISLALKKNMARPEKAKVTSKTAVETSVVNPMHAGKGISDRATRVGQVGAKSSPTTSQ
jgi:hypothetical protein